MLFALLASGLRDLFGAMRAPIAGDAAREPASVVGVNNAQLARLQSRCLLAACVFWPVCALVGAGALLVARSSLSWGSLCGIWGVFELAFAGWFQLTYRRFNRQPSPPPAADPRLVFDRFVVDQAMLSKYINIHEMLSRWFMGRPAEQLTRGNVADLLCYGFWYRSRAQLEAEGRGELPEQLVSELEAAWGVEFAQGPYTPYPMMAHLWEPVRCFSRPLAFYAGIEVLIALKHVMLLAAGFKAYTHMGMRYYTYNLPASTAASPVRARGQADATAPILFLHGVGLGLLPYLNFLLRLSSLGRPVVAMEFRNLSMRACAEVPEEDEIVGRIAGALARHHVRQVHTVAHSYGTFMASRLVQLHRPMVASVALLDPVCFCMYSGKLIRNFVYGSPRTGASVLTWFIARDMAHAVSVSRRFYWSLLNLWPDQLPDHTMVALSARDELVPVKEVVAMLQARTSTRVLMHRTHHHADFIKDLPWQARMVQEVAELVAAAAGGGPVRHARSDSASSYEVMLGGDAAKKAA